MRKTVFVLVLGMCSAVLFAQLTVGGEVKSGILSTRQEDGVRSLAEETRMNSRDDAGMGAGRFRLNLEYRKDNIGFKFRVNWEDWGDVPRWPYGFGYGDFFQDQLTLSIGKLGVSPWGTGERDLLWKELEAINDGGVRFEYKPNFVPGLNVGFVLNGFDGTTPQTSLTAFTENSELLEIFKETVFGVSYTNDFFHIRAAYRLDSEFDWGENAASYTVEDEDGKSETLFRRKDGGQLIYRIEERALGKVLPGFQLWAVGYINGIGIEDANKSNFEMHNWLFAVYDNDYFDAGIRLGFDETMPPYRDKHIPPLSGEVKTVQYVHAKPHFYYKFFGNILNVGASFEYALDFGDTKVYEGSKYYYWEVEPRVQLNFTPNAYAAFTFALRKQYVHDDDGDFKSRRLAPIHQTQWINLRFGIIF
jgi:hypothetical protein